MLAYATRYGEPEIPTDSSDDEWCCIGPTGWRRPRLHDLRAILVAVFYILKSGCPWRLLTRGDFPPRKTVYDWFRRWCVGWAWERLNTQLRERLQARLGRDLGTRTLAPGSWAPSERRRPASAGSKGATRGGKKVSGRKRHML
jgi:putative transposase